MTCSLTLTSRLIDHTHHTVSSRFVLDVCGRSSLEENNFEFISSLKRWQQLVAHTMSWHNVFFSSVLLDQDLYVKPGEVLLRNFKKTFGSFLLGEDKSNFYGWKLQPRFVQHSCNLDTFLWSRRIVSTATMHAFDCFSVFGFHHLCVDDLRKEVTSNQGKVNSKRQMKECLASGQMPIYGKVIL